MFLKAVEHVHDHSGAMNATQIGRQEHYSATVKIVDAALRATPEAGG